jgi:hypothetical protein
MIIYLLPKKALFNGYVTKDNGSTVEAIVEKLIIGETAYDYIERLMDTVIPYWDEMGRYEAWSTTPIGIHKSRLIKWIPTQLNLF